MAKLHRRVSGIPNPDLSRARVLLVTAALVSVVVAGPALAQDGPEIAAETDPSLARIERLVEQLGADDASERETAYAALTTLDEDTLPAIRARIARVTRARPPENWARDILTRFRVRAPREEGADVDVAPGVLTELERSHAAEERRFVLKMAEPLLLWRSLEHIGTFEAQQAAYPLIGLDSGLWMPEARNWVRRGGNDLMAAAIVGRSDRDRYVRQWARWAVETLGAEDPGRAIQSLDEAQLPDVLRAYAMTHVLSAMRVIVSYTSSDRRRVRRAARWAMEQYGGNAIWILRTAYRNETAEHAPREWSWRRLSESLYARVDERRLASVRMALEQGNAALAAGDLDTMQARFDDVLARAPEPDDPAPVASGYAQLARARASRGRAADAERAYRRALRLAPEHEGAQGWRAELQMLEAQRALDRGVLDVAAFEAVLAASPEHEGANAALARIPAIVSGPPHNPRRTWGLVAALLVGLFGLGLLFWTGSEPSAVDVHAETSFDATLEAASVDAPARPSFEPPAFEAPVFDAPLFDGGFDRGFEQGDATLSDPTLPG